MIRIDPEQLENTDEKKILQYLIGEHYPARIQRLKDYYIGEHDILNRTMVDPTKPNNKIVNNLAAYITDTMTGYFMGMPVVYSSHGNENDEYVETLKNVFDENNEQDHNSELSKSQSIGGVSYELLYTDEEGDVRFAELPAENVIYVETDDVGAEPVMAVRIYETNDLTTTDNKKYYYDVFTDNEIITYSATQHNEAVSLTEIDRREHYFGGVPVVAYPNNKELVGDYEGVITLIDAYNLAQSDTANDFEYFTDAYLKLTGVRLDDEAIAKMKENRVIGLPDKECDVAWLIKDINDTALENYKNRIRKDIHALSKTPNLTDESFSGNLTGVAISYKIWGMDQVVSVKERKFKKALQRRISLITNILNTAGRSWDWRDVDITFARNMPQNLTELSQMVAQLRSLVSDETLLALLPFIEDPQLELERIAEQRENEPTIDLDTVPEVDDEPLGDA